MVQFIQAVVPVTVPAGFSAAISGGMQLKAWFWYLTGIALTIALAVLSDLLIKRIPRLNKNNHCWVEYASRHLQRSRYIYRLIPQSILERLAG